MFVQYCGRGCEDQTFLFQDLQFSGEGRSDQRGYGHPKLPTTSLIVLENMLNGKPSQRLRSPPMMLEKTDV